MTLYELAAKLGVETHDSHPTMHQMDPVGTIYKTPRPDLDIAHECLSKLPADFLECFALWFTGEWTWGPHRGGQTEFGWQRGTFIDCVISLCERAGGEKP